MDLGIAGRTALVCGASEGLGLACAQALAREGVNLIIVARRPGPLDEAAADLRAVHGVTVRAVACDITTAAGQEAALEACPCPDILVTNAGGPPPGDFRDLRRDQWLSALNANMLTPIALMRATVDHMVERRFGRIINITSAAVKAPIPELPLSNGARSGLTGFTAGLARQVAQHGVTVNNLLPGLFATARMDKLMQAQAAAQAVSPEQMTQRQRAAIPAGRFGRPDEFGAACAFLCSVHAGYVTGQNLLLDGGAYPGTF
jgi:3-oxoacyl-[acyl-carrier protein] reductase